MKGLGFKDYIRIQGNLKDMFKPTPCLGVGG